MVKHVLYMYIHTYVHTCIYVHVSYYTHQRTRLMYIIIIKAFFWGIIVSESQCQYKISIQYGNSMPNVCYICEGSKLLYWSLTVHVHVHLYVYKHTAWAVLFCDILGLLLLFMELSRARVLLLAGAVDEDGELQVRTCNTENKKE